MYLKQRGFWIVPIQLFIGDFVLSDDICVERKSVSTGDLFESFKSGRLLG
jgi:ERCC4-type nuclease